MSDYFDDIDIPNKSPQFPLDDLLDVDVDDVWQTDETTHEEEYLFDQQGEDFDDCVVIGDDD